MKIEWRQMASPRGEVMQGFWILGQDGQPIVEKPFDTAKEAREHLKSIQ